MATISGQGTTYNLPNYTGDLFQIAPYDTPFLSAIGGLTGGDSLNTVDIEWQTEGLESTSANNSRVEGAVAPTASEVSRSNVTNVLEIHQEAVQISYTKLAAVGLHNGVNDEASNPVRDELSHQVNLKLKKMAIDIEKSFLSGTYAKPSNNSTARATQGVLGAVATNVFANGGTGRAITKAIVDSALSGMYTNGAPLSQDMTVFMVGPGQKISLSNVYSAAPQLNQATSTRNIGGVAIDTIVTDFGIFGVMLNRWMPTGTIAILDMSVQVPKFLNIPGKGAGVFAEPLAKTGAFDPVQLYCEVGLEYGPENYHGLIKDLT